MLVYHLIGDPKINNSISEFSDDQVKSHVTIKGEKPVIESCKLEEVKIIIMQLKQGGRAISNGMT